MNKKYRLLNIFAILFLSMFAFSTIANAASLDCSDWGIIKKDIQSIFNILKYAIPLLIVGLSSFDFINAVAGKDEKDMKKAFQRLTKRLILAVVFYFLPVFINLILDLFNTGASTCIE